MLGHLKEKMSHIIHDVSAHIPHSLERSETKIEAVVKDYDDAMSQLKTQTTAKIDHIEEEIKNFLAIYEGDETYKCEFLKERNCEITRINGVYALQIEQLKLERDKRILELVAEDEAAIRRLQKEKEEEILRVEAENDHYVERLREALEDDIIKSREETRELIFKVRQDKDSQIQKFAAEYQRLKDKYSNI